MGRGVPHGEVGVGGWVDKGNLITSVSVDRLFDTYIQPFIPMEWGEEQRGE